MDSVPRRPNGLETRGNTWRFRKSYPEELRQIIGRREFVKSLKTGDYREAYKKYPLMLIEADNVIAAARRQLEQQAMRDGMPPIRALSTEEIQSIVLTWFHELESGSAPEAEQSRGDLESVDAIEDAVKSDLGALTGLPEGEQWIMSQTDALLAKHSISIAKDSQEYHTVKTLVGRGLIENRTRRLNDIGRGRFDADSYFRGVEYASPLPESVKRNSPRVKHTFGNLLEKYLAERNLAKKTRNQYEQDSRRFIEFVGAETPLDQIGRDEIVAYRELLKRLPSNASKLFKGKTVQEIADSPKAATRDKLNPRTVNKALETLSSLFRFAEEWGLIGKNPAKGLQLPEESDESTQRRPYSIDELQRIFDAPLYRGCKNDKSGFSQSGTNVIRRHRFWIPLISLYSGMRLNEICQLYLEDIKEEDGIPYIHIREWGKSDSSKQDKSLKSDNANRKVPIHPELKRIGLLQYVATLRQQKEKRLFPALVYTEDAGYSDAFQKWYARFLDSIGLNDPTLVFHSFRHTFRDGLREAEVHIEFADRIGGWAQYNSTGRDYGQGPSIPKLYEQIAKVSYPKLDLTHLYATPSPLFDLEIKR